MENSTEQWVSFGAWHSERSTSGPENRDSGCVHTSPAAFSLRALLAGSSVSKMDRLLPHGMRQNHLSWKDGGTWKTQKFPDHPGLRWDGFLDPCQLGEELSILISPENVPLNVELCKSDGVPLSASAESPPKVIAPGFSGARSPFFSLRHSSRTLSPFLSFHSSRFHSAYEFLVSASAV